MDNLPDGVTLEMIDAHFSAPPTDYQCSVCGDGLYEDDVRHYDGDPYCEGCYTAKAEADHRYCTDCGVVERSCFTTSYNDEPYCTTCLLQHITNVKQLAELWQQCIGLSIPQCAPVVFRMNDDQSTCFIGTHEQVGPGHVTVFLTQLSEQDTQILDTALSEANKK